MVRFSCFNPYSQWQKTKKIMERPSFEAMIKSLHDSSLRESSKSSPKSASLNSSVCQAEADATIKDNEKDISGTSSQEPGLKSEKFESKLKCNGNTEDPQTGYIRKCQSLGDGLCNQGLDDCDNYSENEIDQGFSNGSVGHNWSVERDTCKMNGESPTSQQSGAPESDYTVVRSDFNRSVFSVGDRSLEREGAEDFDALVIRNGAGESLGCTPHIHEQTLKKSCSLLDMASSLSPSGQHSDKYLAPHHRSHEDLRALEMTWRDVSGNGVETQDAHGWARDDDCDDVKTNDKCPLDDVYDSYNYFNLAKDWIMPETDEDNLVKFKGKSIQHFDEVKSSDFKVKRIEAWVNDLPHCDPLLEEDKAVDDGSNDDPLKRDSTFSNGLMKAKMDNKKVIPGIEIAKRYISSMNPSATSAQLSNHGLVAIPFLSSFVSLRVLNLSGNAIERITAGALPRGLHALNMSNNKITSIEGLRELTRLRVLDLSYNRIVRIGHGLASCSSLKELYLVGNKISEVEGLHRLLKLTVLDLRFNKISSAKCLGQLAANYSSLQAISLEGNPAQKNVGYEQLKKHVLGLLPHLIYYNQQPTKSRTLKDAADRSVRLGISAHQFDRGPRLGSRTAWKGSHGVNGSSHAHKSQVRARHVNRQPSGTSKAMHHFDWGSKLREFTSELSIRRSLSEGTLGTA